MGKTLEQLNNLYQYKEIIMPIHPIHKKWLEAAWEIQNVYGLLHNEQISIGKARELTTSIIEFHSVKERLLRYGAEKLNEAVDKMWNTEGISPFIPTEIEKNICSAQKDLYVILSAQGGPDPKKEDYPLSGLINKLTELKKDNLLKIFLDRYNPLIRELKSLLDE